MDLGVVLAVDPDPVRRGRHPPRRVDADAVREVEVLWPSGAIQSLTEPIELNTTLEIREPQ